VTAGRPLADVLTSASRRELYDPKAADHLHGDKGEVCAHQQPCRLRALTPQVPVLVYSSLSFEANRRDDVRAGAIVKPGEFTRLVDAVVRLCGAQ
jgi:hypothetical protein